MIPRNKPYVKIDIIQPIGRDIMLISNNKDCFDKALNVIRAHEAYLKLDKPRTHGGIKPTTHEKYKVWIDIKSGVKPRDLLEQLAQDIGQTLKSQGLQCEIIWEHNLNK